MDHRPGTGEGLGKEGGFCICRTLIPSGCSVFAPAWSCWNPGSLGSRFHDFLSDVSMGDRPCTGEGEGKSQPDGIGMQCKHLHNIRNWSV